MSDSERGETPPLKRPKRTYRACYPCRSVCGGGCGAQLADAQRKLKCSFGDPDRPWDGPCVRCTRERRECVRAMSTLVRYSLPDVPMATVQAGPSSGVLEMQQSIGSSAVASGPERQGGKHGEGTPFSSVQHTNTESHRDNSDSRSVPPEFGHHQLSHQRGSDIEDGTPRPENDHSNDHSSPVVDEDSDGPRDSGRALLMSNLQNPNDALRLLASASSLRYGSRTIDSASGTGPSVGPQGSSSWKLWPPIQDGCVTEQEAGALLCFFELRMAPLYPLIHKRVLEPRYLPTLVQDEPLLLGAIIGIASRYSDILAPERATNLHKDVAHWVRDEITNLMDGDAALRSVSTVEALLLLAEWPMLPAKRKGRTADEPDSEEARLLRPSVRYDAYCWSNVGLAMRIAQELGMEDSVFAANDNELSQHHFDDWKHERNLKTWVYCYNAETHVAARLGRSAVTQHNMTTRWWEGLGLFNERRKNRTADDGASDLINLTNCGQLLISIQQHLYWSKDVTNTLLRSGAWESFMRSMRMDMRHNRHYGERKLREGTLGSALLRLEFDYLVLYANSLALRSLQRRLRLARQDPLWEMPTLLNAVEGPWIMEALSAARSILETALGMLESKGHLRFCPSRVFQYILFATTFLYKALAIGAVEHGESSVIDLLESTVAALGRATIDDQHFLSGFAVLLARLGKHWRSPNHEDPSSHLVFGPKPPASTATRHVPTESLPPMPTNQNPSVHQALSGMHTSSQNDTSSVQNTLGRGAPAPSHAGSVDCNSGFVQPTSPPIALANGDALVWGLDLASHMPEADLAQDVMFQSIWDSANQAAGAASSNVYATLLGEAFNLPEGF